MGARYVCCSWDVIVPKSLRSRVCVYTHAQTHSCTCTLTFLILFLSLSLFIKIQKLTLISPIPSQKYRVHSNFPFPCFYLHFLAVRSPTYLIHPPYATNLPIIFFPHTNGLWSSERVPPKLYVVSFLTLPMLRHVALDYSATQQLSFHYPGSNTLPCPVPAWTT